MMEQASEANKPYKVKYQEAYKAFKTKQEEIPLVKVVLKSAPTSETKVSGDSIDFSVAQIKYFLQPSKKIWNNILLEWLR